MPAPLLVRSIPAEAQNLKMAQVDVQLGRDRDDSYRHRRDSDVTVGVGPGGITVGPRRNCRMVTTTIDRGGVDLADALHKFLIRQISIGMFRFKLEMSGDPRAREKTCRRRTGRRRRR
jgi:hypothetical protein